MASLSTSASFHQTFQALQSDVLAALTRPEPAASEATKILTDLKGQLSSVLSSLPSYDQRSYELQVRDLETKVAAVRAKSRPKTKFAFSKPARVASQVSSVDTVPAKDDQEILPEDSSDGNAVAGPSSLHRKISNRTNERILLSELDIPGGSQRWTLSLEDLEGCTVDLRPATDSPASGTPSGLSSLHARRLKNCRIYAGRIAGSAMLHDLEGCTFVAAVQQFRIHTSQDCDISLYIPSVPIIESCSNLTFHPHVPDTLDTTTDMPPNRVSQVADFSWIKPTPSPNWKYVEEPQTDPPEHGDARTT